MSTITKEFTKEQLQQIIETDHVQCGEASALARIALASLEAEAVHQVLTGDAWVDLSKGAMESQKRVGAIVRTLHTAPPAPVSVPDDSAITQHFDTIALETAREIMCDVSRRHEFLGGEVQLLSRIQCRIDDACRAAMLQGAEHVSNRDELPDGWVACSERMPKREVDVQVYCAEKKEQMVAYLERNEGEGLFRFATWRTGDGIYCQPTHWMPLPAAPQQEVK